MEPPLVVKLDDALQGVTRLGFDAEAYPAYDALVAEVFRRIAAGRFAAITSVIQTFVISVAAAERAAALRARYHLRLPDALQIAVALEAGCEAFLTNDRALKRVAELRVLVLDELEL